MTTDRRYARHFALADVGEAGQRRFEQTRVLIIGLGGLGCPAAQYLASSGIGHLILNDFDRVDETNLPRQILFTDEDVGAPKVEAAAAKLALLNPDVNLDLLPRRLDEAGLRQAVATADIVLDCVDNFGTRLAINGAAVEAQKPLVTGAAIRQEGQLAVFFNAGGGPCYRCLYSEDDELLGSCEGNGVLAPVPGAIGTLMANEALKLVLGSADNGRLLLWDAARGLWQTLTINPDPDCPVCGATSV